MKRISTYINNWIEKSNRFLNFNARENLNNTGYIAYTFAK